MKLSIPWIFTIVVCAALAYAGSTAPTAVQQPGTQPTEVNSFASNCDTCHADTDNPSVEPSHGWKGGMMAHAVRDGLFWASVAIAEQDFLPGTDPEQRGGAGDLCLRCHGPGGWLSGLSEPTDGSSFTANESRGVECEFCHLLVDPDQPLSVSGTTEVQNPPFEAFDPSTGEGYYGSGQYVINGEGTRLGPYADADANHPFYPSDLHRRSELCGTCHDVSNPVTGDVAHNNGAQTPLAPGSFSGSLDSLVEQKAQFLNPPFAYGMVERTYSEWKASALATWQVNDFSSLPPDLQVVGGSLDIAYHRAFDARGDADYEDGTIRTFTCQTCHMAAATGVGCSKNNMPVRDDLPRHDQTGGGYWMPDVVTYQDQRGTLLLGGGLGDDQTAALRDGALRAQEHLASAASLSAVQDGTDVVVTITNLTGHKLISGYPEGRRMWLELVWSDEQGQVVRTDGAYGPIGRSVDDLDGAPHQVESLIDPGTTVVFEAVPGIDQQWAQQLIGLEYPADMVLDYDRMTDAPEHTLGDLQAMPAGIALETFHFVLNNVMTKDNRIPPFGFDRDEAAARNALPVPATLYGDPLPGGTYGHAHDARFAIPATSTGVAVRLKYQQTSWEYIQFLWLANDGLSPVLGDEGLNMLDAWANTGMSPPAEMSAVTITVSASDNLIFADGFETGGVGAWS